MYSGRDGVTPAQAARDNCKINSEAGALQEIIFILNSRWQREFYNRAGLSTVNPDASCFLSCFRLQIRLNYALICSTFPE